MLSRRSLFARRPVTRVITLVCIGFSLPSLFSLSRTPTSLLPAHLDKAEYAGSKSCEKCHQEIYRDFNSSTHAAMGFSVNDNEDQGCEACHGPGSIHNKTSLASDIIHPDKQPGACFQCHLNRAAQFRLPGAHPLHPDRVSCSDCHNVHEGPVVAPVTQGRTSYDQACFECHRAQSGPFTFVHEAMREGCTFCHDPHGAVNQGMLRVRNANLCLQCHYADLSTSDVVIGGVQHGSFRYIQQGACWTAGCHEAVHGSHANPLLRY